MSFREGERKSRMVRVVLGSRVSRYLRYIRRDTLSWVVQERSGRI